MATQNAPLTCAASSLDVNNSTTVKRSARNCIAAPFALFGGNRFTLSSGNKEFQRYPTACEETNAVFAPLARRGRMRDHAIAERDMQRLSGPASFRGYVFVAEQLGTRGPIGRRDGVSQRRQLLLDLQVCGRFLQPATSNLRGRQNRESFGRMIAGERPEQHVDRSPVPLLRQPPFMWERRSDRPSGTQQFVARSSTSTDAVRQQRFHMSTTEAPLTFPSTMSFPCCRAARLAVPKSENVCVWFSLKTRLAEGIAVAAGRHIRTAIS
ncbi:hypothetical protein HDG34_004198 [Paraburkholderia sp. HC6.4b]|nr:hypothetical protein [Paraburkholderia sp. HC6.4b]MBB5452454.1 hypothetical protein [Paraburkholderia sp. Kb1A]